MIYSEGLPMFWTKCFHSCTLRNKYYKYVFNFFLCSPCIPHWRRSWPSSCRWDRIPQSLFSPWTPWLTLSFQISCFFKAFGCFLNYYWTLAVWLVWRCMYCFCFAGHKWCGSLAQDTSFVRVRGGPNCQGSGGGARSGSAAVTRGHW